MAGEKAERTRRPSFSADEEQVIFNSFLEKKTSASLHKTPEARRKFWEEIVASVNACGIAERTENEVKDWYFRLKESFAAFKTDGAAHQQHPEEEVMRVMDDFFSVCSESPSVENESETDVDSEEEKSTTSDSSIGMPSTELDTITISDDEMDGKTAKTPNTSWVKQEKEEDSWQKQQQQQQRQTKQELGQQEEQMQQQKQNKQQSSLQQELQQAQLQQVGRQLLQQQQQQQQQKRQQSQKQRKPQQKRPRHQIEEEEEEDDEDDDEDEEEEEMDAMKYYPKRKRRRYDVVSPVASLENDEDLKNEYLNSCITMNHSKVQLQELQIKKCQMEIRLLQAQLDKLQRSEVTNMNKEIDVDKLQRSEAVNMNKEMMEKSNKGRNE